MSETQVAKRHPQFILGMDASYFTDLSMTSKDEAGNEVELAQVFQAGITSFSAQTWLDSAQSYLVIREREWLDEIKHGDQQFSSDLDLSTRSNFKGDRKVRQLLPYLIARQIRPDGTYLYFPYRRTKGVGEARLVGNGSIGYGGHIDLDDVMSTKSIIDLEGTIVLGMLREAAEEFDILDESGDVMDLESTDIVFGNLFILDNSDDVGNLHVGIVMLLDVPAGYTLQTKEDELATLPPMTGEQMLSDPNFKAEGWTRLYLEYIRDTDLSALTETGDKEDIDDSEEFVSTTAPAATLTVIDYHDCIVSLNGGPGIPDPSTIVDDAPVISVLPAITAAVVENEIANGTVAYAATGISDPVAASVAVLSTVDAIQDANATVDTPYPPVANATADAVAKVITGDPTATFDSVSEAKDQAIAASSEPTTDSSSSSSSADAGTDN